jgi:hypothetical protein
MLSLRDPLSCQTVAHSECPQWCRQGPEAGGCNRRLAFDYQPVAGSASSPSRFLTLHTQLRGEDWDDHRQWAGKTIRRCSRVVVLLVRMPTLTAGHVVAGMSSLYVRVVLFLFYLTQPFWGPFGGREKHGCHCLPTSPAAVLTQTSVRQAYSASLTAALML